MGKSHGKLYTDLLMSPTKIQGLDAVWHLQALLWQHKMEIGPEWRKIMVGNKYLATLDQPFEF